MDRNQQSSADHIIEHLNAIEVDGETIGYIVSGTYMKEQLLRQLFMNATDLEINNLLNERTQFHDRGSNSHFNI
ncbi:MAG: hypothetical protein ACOVOQ_08825 [Flavobacterium sp.]|jgi:ribulose kinase